MKEIKFMRRQLFKTNQELLSDLFPLDDSKQDVWMLDFVIKFTFTQSLNKKPLQNLKYLKYNVFT